MSSTLLDLCNSICYDIELYIVISCASRMTSIFLPSLRVFLNLTSTADMLDSVFKRLVFFFNLILCNADVKSLAFGLLMFLDDLPGLPCLSTRPISIFTYALKNAIEVVSIAHALHHSNHSYCVFLSGNSLGPFCVGSVTSSMLDSLLGSLLSKLGGSAPLIPLTPAHDLNLLTHMT
jgi:hypothetical protein